MAVTHNPGASITFYHQGNADEVMPEPLEEPVRTFYNILERNEFYLSLKKCEDPSELMDTFLSEEDLQAYKDAGAEQGSYHHHSNEFCLYFENKIRETLATWPALMSPTAYSTKRTTAQIDLALEVCDRKYNLMWHTVPDGYTIHGRTLYHNERWAQRKRDRVPSRSNRILKRDVTNLIKAIDYAIKSRHGVELNLKQYMWEAKATVYLGKKLVNWKNVNKVLRDGRWNVRVNKIDMPHIKKVWQDPEVISVLFTNG